MEQVRGHYSGKILCYLPSCICFVSQRLIPTHHGSSMPMLTALKYSDKKSVRLAEKIEQFARQK